MSASLVVPDGAEAMPEEKVRQLKQAFTLLDKSGDGSIKPKDLKAFMESLGHECTEVELEDMVSDCNTPCTRTPRTHTCPPARPCTSTAISSTAHLAPHTLHLAPRTSHTLRRVLQVSECNKAAGAHGDEGGRNGEVEFKAFYTAMLPTLKASPEAQDSGAFKVRRLRRSLRLLRLGPRRRHACLHRSLSLRRSLSPGLWCWWWRPRRPRRWCGLAGSLAPVPPHPCRHTRAATPMPRQMFDKEGKGFVTVEEMKKKMCSATPS